CSPAYCRCGVAGELVTDHQYSRQPHANRGDFCACTCWGGTEAMSRFQLFLQVTRARTLPVMLAPVLIGSVLAWEQNGHFQWGLFVLALVGALAAHLGANVINDVFDFAEGADQAAYAIMPEGKTLTTGSQFLLNGQLSLRAYRGLAVGCF